MTIRLAFSGAGYIANIHATAAQSLPEVEITGLVDFKPEETLAFQENFHIKSVFTNVDDLIAQNAADALIVCTPNALHAPQTITALKGGLHVMVEKPMAINLEEADSMIEAAELSGKKLMVAHCWRFDEEAQWLRHHIATDKLGKIVRTKSYGIHENWGPKGWFTDKKLSGGGALVDMGIHAIDTTRFLLGDPRPVKVYSCIGTYYMNADVDDTGIMTISWDNGTVSLVEFGWWQPHMDGPEAGTRIYGDKGYGSLFPTTLEIPNHEKVCVDHIDPGFEFPRENHCLQSMYDRQMAYFIKCVNEDINPIPGGLEGRINLAVIDAAYRSARSGKVEEVQC